MARSTPFDFYMKAMVTVWCKQCDEVGVPAYIHRCRRGVLVDLLGGQEYRFVDLA